MDPLRTHASFPQPAPPRPPGPARPKLVLVPRPAAPARPKLVLVPPGAPPPPPAGAAVAAAAKMFFAAKREEIKRANPEATTQEMLKLLGAAWQAASEAERKPFVEAAAERAAAKRAAVAAAAGLATPAEAIELLEGIGLSTEEANKLLDNVSLQVGLYPVVNLEHELNKWLSPGARALRAAELSQSGGARTRYKKRRSPKTKTKRNKRKARTRKSHSRRYKKRYTKKRR